MRQSNISWPTAASGFVFLALTLAGAGFLLSKSLDDQSGGTAAGSSERTAWETVMRGLSRHAHNSAEQ